LKGSRGEGEIKPSPLLPHSCEMIENSDAPRPRKTPPVFYGT
jgi:hypothetical protein